jgi:hypothetical protein
MMYIFEKKMNSHLRLKASEVDATLAATSANTATLYPRRNIIVAMFDKHNDLNRRLIVLSCEMNVDALDYTFQFVTQQLWLMTNYFVWLMTYSTNMFPRHDSNLVVRDVHNITVTAPFSIEPRVRIDNAYVIGPGQYQESVELYTEMFEHVHVASDPKAIHQKQSAVRLQRFWVENVTQSAACVTWRQMEDG